jgi:hypothetical protein
MFKFDVTYFFHDSLSLFPVLRNLKEMERISLIIFCDSYGVRPFHYCSELFSRVYNCIETQVSQKIPAKMFVQSDEGGL